MEHRWNRRERKKLNKRKHKVIGKSVFDILKIWERNWKDIKRNGKEWKGIKGNEKV